MYFSDCFCLHHQGSVWLNDQKLHLYSTQHALDYPRVYSVGIDTKCGYDVNPWQWRQRQFLKHWVLIPSLHHWSLEKTSLRTVTMMLQIIYVEKIRSIIITCIFWHKILTSVMSIMTYFHLCKIFIVKCTCSCKILRYFKHN
jgi:hypothetical protein